jgi:hypothetical protein
MEKLKLNPDRSLEPAPGRTAFDYGLAVAKVAAIAFPFLGAGVTLVDLVTAPMRGKRFSDWCEELRLSLNELSDKVDGLTPEALAKDEAFFSTFAQAAQSAIRTHQREKLDALRNAVLNTAIGNSQSPDYDMVFLSLIERFTPLHLKVLATFATEAFPPRYIDESLGDDPSSSRQADYERRQSLYQWVRARVPDLEGDEGFLQALLTDLSGAGLTTIHPEIRSVAADRLGGTATEFGRALLRFISSPVTTVAEKNS